MMIDVTHTSTPDTFVYPGTPAPAVSSTRTLTHDGAAVTFTLGTGKTDISDILTH